MNLKSHLLALLTLALIVPLPNGVSYAAKKGKRANARASVNVFGVEVDVDVKVNDDEEERNRRFDGSSWKDAHADKGKQREEAKKSSGKKRKGFRKNGFFSLAKK